MHGARRDPALVGRPSACARGRLAVGLRDQIDGSKLAWEAALLRGDAAISAGDAREAEAALDEQRALLVALEARLGEVVASATVEREAEHVVTAAPDPPRRRPLRHVPAVLGSAAAALVAFAVATLTGLPGVPDVASVSEAITSAGDARPYPADDARHDDLPATGTAASVFEARTPAPLPAFEGSVPADAATAGGATSNDATSASEPETPAGPSPDEVGDRPRDDDLERDPTRSAPRPALVLPEGPAPHPTSPPDGGSEPPGTDLPATPTLDLGTEDLAARLADDPDDDPDDVDGLLLP